MPSQINLLAQLGLVLFMFMVGLEINPKILRQRLPLATRLSLVGVALPMVLGVGLASVLESWLPDLIPGDRTLPGILFMGVAMARHQCRLNRRRGRVGFAGRRFGLQPHRLLLGGASQCWRARPSTAPPCCGPRPLCVDGCRGG